MERDWQTNDDQPPVEHPCDATGCLTQEQSLGTADGDSLIRKPGAEGSNHIRIGKENYFLSADGLLMPAKKNQEPPNLRYFDQAQK